MILIYSEVIPIILISVKPIGRKEKERKGRREKRRKEKREKKEGRNGGRKGWRKGGRKIHPPLGVINDNKCQTLKTAIYGSLISTIGNK